MKTQLDYFEERKYVPAFEINQSISEDIIRISNISIFSESISKLVYSSGKEIPNFEKRRERIIDEIVKSSSDIISCQNFEKDEILINKLKTLGFSVIFKPKYIQYQSSTSLMEGCALIINNSKFEISDVLSLVFNINNDNDYEKDSESQVNISNSIKNEDYTEIFNKDNCAVVAVLDIGKTHTLIVSSFDFLYTKSRGDVKLGQYYQLSIGIDKIKKKLIAENKNKVITSVICGNLNCLPSSGVYKFVKEGVLNLTSSTNESLSMMDNTVKPSILNNDYMQVKNSLYNSSKLYDDKMLYSTNYVYLPTREYYKTIKSVDVEYIRGESLLTLVNKEEKVNDDEELIIKSPLKFQSAYSKVLSYFVDYFLSENEMDIKFPLNLYKIHNINDLKSVDCFGFKAGKSKISTYNYFNELSLEPLFTTYLNNELYTSNYIFYEEEDSGIVPIRVLDMPDLKWIINQNLPFEKVYMPFFVLSVDFLINKSKN